MKNIYDIQGNVLMQIPVTPECEHAEELMRTDEVRMFWNAADCAVIPAGAYVEVPERGEKYYLVEPYKPIQRKENMWRYEPVFVSAFYALSKVPFYMYTYEGSDPTGQITSREADWVLTDTPYNFISTLCRAIKNETGVKYLPAAALDLPASATVTFASTDIISALGAIANAFETEFWLEKFANPDSSGNVGRIHLGFANDGATPKVLTVGTNINVPSVSDGREGFYNRFVILGSTRNITQEYRGANVNSIANKRLTLDPTTYPGGYIDYSDGAVYTKILVFDGVYPAANLRIKSGSVLARLRYVLDENGDRIEIQPGVYSQYAIYYFKLEKYENGQWSDFVFNNTDYDPVDNPSGMRLPNQKVSIHFSSGPLMGREFELEYHEDALVNVQDKADELPFSAPAGSFEIVKTQEGDYIIPALTGLVPGANDEVILFNIMMSETYVVSAQDRLEAEAFKEIGKNYLQLNADGTAKRDAAGNLLRVDKNSYQFTSNPVAFNASNPGLKIASAVTYVNGAYSLATRVKAIVTKLDYPIKQTITVGEELTKGTIEELKDNAANANDDINLLDALSASTQRLLDAYNRTQEFIQAGLADDYFELNETLTTLVQLKAAYQYLGAKNGLFFAGASMTGTPEPDLYVKVVGEGANQQRVLYSPLALITAGDQIVGNGTPGGGGGGGGGAGYLYELGDVYGSTYVLRPDGSPKQGGDILGYNSSIGKWVAVDGSTIGGVTSVVGQTGTVTVSQIASALTAADYKLTDTVITDYWKTGDTRTKNTVLAAPNGSNGAATFRALVPADIPSLAISKITNLQTSLDAKQDTISDLDTIRSNASTGVAAYNALGNYVLKAGDTMTGNLIIEKTGGGLTIRGERLNANADGGYIYLAARYYNNERNGVKIAAVYPGSGAYDIQDLVFYSSDNRSGDASPIWQEAMRIKSTKAVSVATSLAVGTTLSVSWLATLSGGASIPVNKKLTIGDAEIEWIPNSGNGYLRINKPLLTVGDQIVNSGTPGGGGGGSGASSLFELADVLTDANKTKVKQYDGTTNAANGNMFAFNGSKWYALKLGTNLSITNGTLNATDTTYSNGTGLALSNGVFSITSAYQTNIANGASAYSTLTTSQTKNKVLASPSSASGAPSFRALVAADIPSLTVSKISDLDTNYVSIASSQTVSAKHTFSTGLLLNTASSWSNTDRALFFSASDEMANLRYYSTDASKGLMFNPYSGALKAGSFVKLGGGSGFLKADGSEDTTAYLPLSGGTMTGDIKMTNGEYINAESGYAMLGIGSGGTNFYCGPGAEITGSFLIRSGNIDLTHVKAGTNYTIWDASNSNLSTVNWAANNLAVAGTSTFSNTMYVENSKAMYWKDSGGTYRNTFGLNNSNSLLIGYGLSSVTGSVTTIYGETVRLQASGNNEIVKLGGATLVLRGTQLNNQVHTILFRGGESESNGFKIQTTAASSYGRQSLGFYRSNATPSSAPYTPDWKRSLYLPYDGGVIIGTSSDDCNLTVYGSVTSSGDQVISSDATLKTNLRDLRYSTRDIAACRAVTFDWKDGSGRSAGSIAQDWKRLVPELVHGKEGSMTLAYGQVALINTVIEAREIEKLKKRIDELEREIKRLRG